jgi:hypothetical protein
MVKIEDLIPYHLHSGELEMKNKSHMVLELLKAKGLEDIARNYVFGGITLIF